MTGSIPVLHRRQHGVVLELAIDNPPVNALGAVVRAALMDAILAAQDDSGIEAIVLRGEGKHLSGGADITEFDRPPVAPVLPDVVSAVEACTKPVIAAISGNALGGGLEISLGCHYRIAARSARLGLPEVKLGFIPGAGGTQRLPRLVGVAAALDMITTGDPLDATKALAIGLVDAVVADEALLDEALVLARSCPPIRRTGERIAVADDATFSDYLAAHPRRFDVLLAGRSAVDAIKDAVALPLAMGLARERAATSELRQGSQSRALRHVFFAERAAAKLSTAGLDARPRSVTQVGIVGGGTMGIGIAINFLTAGFPVTIVEPDTAAQERGYTRLREVYARQARQGRMSTEQATEAVARVGIAAELEAVAGCDLIIEAVYEDMAVKKDIFARLDSFARPGALLASNTSYLDIDAIAAVTSRPQDVVGLHFFSPANVMTLVEVVQGRATSREVMLTALQIAQHIGKVPVVSGVCHGFIGNRMLQVRRANALDLVLQGASPAQIDRIHTDFGMPMGPFQMTDLAGMDIGWHRDPSRVETLRDAFCAAGRLGQKSGAGFYDYDETRRPLASPVSTRIIADYRRSMEISSRPIEDEEIRVRTLYTMINEGAMILEEGIAQRASDIDVVWIHGYGWPRHTGGPMYWAQEIGLKRIVAGLDEYRHRLGPDFRFSQRLLDAARDGGRLGQ